MLNFIKTEEQSLWKQDNLDNWRLFFNLYEKAKVSLKPKTVVFKSPSLVMGSLVMTPEGIGRLLEVKGNRAVVKLKDEQEFHTSEVSQTFSINIKIKYQSGDTWYRLSVPANGEIAKLKAEIHKLGLMSDMDSYMLIHNGSEVLEGQFFEKMGLKNNDKMLLLPLKPRDYKITRVVDKINPHWYAYSLDSIIFFVNKRVKLTGMGYFKSSNGKAFKANIKICEVGDSEAVNDQTSTRGGRGSNVRRQTIRARMAENTLYDGNVESVVTGGQDFINEWKFDKPVQLMAYTDYVVIVTYIDVQDMNLYYTSNNLKTVMGEKGVEFSFRHAEISCTSRVEQGNFPEFYYSI
jgi:hypothetical protein